MRGGRSFGACEQHRQCSQLFARVRAYFSAIQRTPGVGIHSCPCLRTSANSRVASDAVDTPPSDTQERTPLGELLEDARLNVLHLAVREAARRAGISEARWRQVVSGWQSGRAGARIPAMPRPRTVVAMARAVDVDPAHALAAAGLKISTAGLAALMVEPQISNEGPRKGIDVGYEIDRITKLDVPARTKLALIRKILELAEEAETEDQQ